MPKPGHVYILASKRNGTLYVGVTSNLARRIWEHKTDAAPGFTREKHIKEWKRAWKIRLIESQNPDWRDLYEDIGP